MQAGKLTPPSAHPFEIAMPIDTPRIMEPGHEYTALQLTCALIASGNFTATTDPKVAAKLAVELLRHVRESLPNAIAVPSEG